MDAKDGKEEDHDEEDPPRRALRARRMDDAGVILCKVVLGFVN